MLGKLKDLTINRDESQNITLTVYADCREMFDDLKDSDVDIEIKKHYKARSLDASAKAWVLIDALAEKLRISKKEVYQNAIKEIGGVTEVVCVKDITKEDGTNTIEFLCNNWQSKGQGWMTKVEPSKLPGCKNITLWYGSSSYNTKQMADLIAELVSECNEQGIPTMSQKEIDRLLESWGKKKEKEAEKNRSEANV